MFAQLFVCLLLFLRASLAELRRDFHVSESAPVGHHIGYVNGSASNGLQPNYFIIYPDANAHADEYLMVDEISGEVSVRKALDYESVSLFDLLAVPTNGASALHVYVNVDDVNDNAPTFPVPLINIEISEYARLHAEISLPSATDPDSPPFSVQKYRILSGNVNNAFRLSTRKLNSILYVDLVVNGQLDREYRSHYDLIVEALDGGNPPRSGKLRVNVTVLDANDNAPEFSQPRYSARIASNATVGTVVTTVYATDADTGPNANVTYSIAKGRPNTKSYFVVDQRTGVVRLAESDLEPGSTHEVIVVASDQGLPQPLESTAFLSIVVEKSSEARTQLDIVWLTDSATPDILENLTLGYVLARIAVIGAKPNSDVQLNGSESICVQQTDSASVYLLIVCGPLDREFKSSYSLLFFLRTDGNIVLEHPVHLEILDVNDNAPHFEQSQMRVTLNRSTDQFDVLKIAASDPDAGDNGRVHYSILDTDVITVERDTAILHLMPDYDCSVGEIRFRLKAEDSGTPSLSSIVDVTADIVDSNGRPPVFTKPLYEVTVKEDIEAGSCLLKVQASDACGASGKMRYTIREQSIITKVFSVDDHSGTVCIAQSLDYETTTNYQFTVIASDPSGHTSTALVNVIVQDVNDNNPVFYPLDYSLSVKEDIGVGSPVLVVSASDADEGTFGQVRYRIVSGSFDEFRMEAQSGHLYVQKALTHSNYDIVVQATDGGGLTSEQEAKVHISVISPSTPTPQFSSNLYTFTTTEDVLPGISIGQVEAVGPYPITYSIYSGDPEHLFTIEPASGKLTVARYLDSDKWRSLLLNIQARMEGGGTNHTQVVVELADTNDNAPHFEMERVETSVPEDQPTHLSFFAVRATDRDHGKNGEVTYSVVQSSPPCPVVVQPVSGELSLSASLDFERVREYELVIRARDRGIPPRSANITVALHVLDVNDNAPQFEMQLYVAEVSEDATLMSEVVTVKAKDVDSQHNGKVSFRFAEEVPDFGISPTTGIVYVKSPLDRERTAEYRLIVIAFDHGQKPQSSNATVHIVVLDVNDNSPNCSTVKSLSVGDDTPVGDVFASISASDPDAGVNSTLVYRIQNDDPNFAVDSQGGVSLRRALSPSSAAKEYRISVIVSDSAGGVLARSALCQVRILFERVQSKVAFIEPLNRIIRFPLDCVHQCDLVRLNATNVSRWEIETNEISRFFEVSNGVLRGKSTIDGSLFKTNRPLTLSAFDVDNRKRTIVFTIRPFVRPPTTDRNSTIFLRLPTTTAVGSKLTTVISERTNSFCSIYNESSRFQVDELTSSLYLAASLREYSAGSVSIGVLCSAPPEYTAEEIDVFIELDGENLHRPNFPNCPMSVTVGEDEQIGSTLAKLWVVDGDESPFGQVTFRINDSASSFAVDPSSGEVTLARPLDWSVQRQLFLVVEAEDCCSDLSKRASCAIFVEVEDVNDNAPVFLSASNVSITDVAISSKPFHFVVARDVDGGENGRVTYAIVGGNRHNDFSINEKTGALKLNRRLNSSVTLQIRASDNGKFPKFAHQHLTIEYRSNERRWKYFSSTSYEFVVQKDLRPGTFIYDFSANGVEKPSLKLLSNFVTEEHFFEISTDGKLFLSTRLNDSLYRLIVLATNDQNQSDWASIRIRTGRGNRNPPRISSTSCGNVTVLENLQVPFLTRVFAFDGDDGNDGQVEFRILAGNEGGVFAINSSTGVISCKELDRERKPEYLLVITAEDHGTPARADTCTIRVTVSDENDNLPLFDPFEEERIEVNDNTAVGSVLAKVTASDADEGPNGEVVYSITEDKSALLDIRYNSGEIFLARDHATVGNEFVIRVRAEDLGKSRVLSSEKSIRLVVKRSKTEWKVDRPSFLSQQYIGFVREGQPKGQFVLKIGMSGGVTGDAPLTYSIVSGNVDAAFEVDNDGRVVSGQELDAEILNEYSLQVLANGAHSNSPKTNVLIRVLNTNDNVPSIPQMKPRKISETVTVGTLIAMVTATDVDVDSQLVYSLNPASEFFEMNPFTGAIHLTAPLDFETAKMHKLGIQVSDGENVSNATLIVEVVDENDNAPVFDKEFYEISVTKSERVGNVVCTISARDADSGPAGRIRYNFAEGNDVFAIDTETAAITLKSPLKAGAIHYVKVHAFDAGTPPLGAAVTVRIEVLDSASKTKPEFDKKSYSFAVSEDTLAHVSFGRIRLRNHSEDVDSFDFRLVDSAANRLFNIDHNGFLSLRALLDREKQREFKFVVEAFSNAFYENATVNVYVDVLDVNDNSPVFAPFSKKISISEHTKEGEVLMRISASDADAAENGHVTYRIVSGNDLELFTLDGVSGALRFNRWTDEVFLHNSSATSVDDIIVVAMDGGIPPRWTSARISVIADRTSWSATAPFFVLPLYQKTLFENAAIGSVVVHSRAVNRAGIVEQGWHYSLKDNDQTFVCNETTGDILLAKALDFETRAEYEFSLAVSDLRARSAVVPVRIRVLGIDEYPPLFLKPAYTFQIPRSAQVGQRVGAVSASDQDSGIDGVIRYEIEGSAISYLEIDSDSGQIVLRKELPFSIDANVTTDEFIVIASSGASQHSKVPVRIEIGEFGSSSEDATGSLFGVSSLAVGAVLLLVLVVSLTLLVVRMRYRARLQRKPQKQVYSVSRGNVAVMADIYRASPKFEYEKQRIPLPSPPIARAKTSSSSSGSRCSEESIRLHPKMFVDSLPSMEHAISGRSGSRSMPDSGIEPDEVSMTSSVTDYLTQIGVTRNKIFDQKCDAMRERFPPRRNEARYDADLHELIYAKVDEILSPTSRLSTSYPSSSNFSIPPFNGSPLKSNATPLFQPLSEVLTQISREPNSASTRSRDVVNIDI